ncbi:hypothetical protein VXM60_10560 [Shewanella khirikhana]|uniref:hypothetical protein n=1 Tax=Shewanella khirikhana TaxID=1965282 RepID=UPI0030D2022C
MMQLIEIKENDFGETCRAKLLRTGGLWELEFYAENLAKSLGIKEMQWRLLGGFLVGDEKVTIDNKRSLRISKTKYLLIDTV